MYAKRTWPTVLSLIIMALMAAVLPIPLVQAFTSTADQSALTIQNPAGGGLPVQVTACAPLPQIVSRASSATGVQGNLDSAGQATSADGRYVAFRSQASNLVPNDTNNEADIFVRDQTTCEITRVSVATGGAQANGSSAHPSLSADGRFVVFHSEASNLALNDYNHVADVFLHDRQTGQTTLISRAVMFANSPLIAANNVSWQPVISADGAWIAFSSQATNIITTIDDSNGTFDVFLYDRQHDQFLLVSHTAAGSFSAGESGGPSISADGRYVAFASTGLDLVTGDTTLHSDIYLYDRLTNTNTRISLAPGGVEPNGLSTDASISADGRFVAYSSTAYNLAGGDIGGCPTFPSCSDIFLYDRQAGTTTRVSMTISATPTDGHSRNPSISADGRFVVFDSGSMQLAVGDTKYCSRTDIPPFITNTPAPPNATSTLAPPPTICVDCRDASATATPSYPSDNSSCPDIFLYDRQLGTLQLISAVGGALGNERSLDPVISGDGHVIIFDTRADNLVTPDSSSHQRDVVAVANPNSPPVAFNEPTNLTAIGLSASQIQVTWTDTTSDETAFRIERSADGVMGWVEVGNVPADSTSFTDSGLVCGTPYYYRVRAYRNGDYSAYSNQTSGTTLACAMPNPTNLTATQLSWSQVQLAWTDNASDESEYRIERSRDGLIGWSQIAVQPADSTTYLSEGLACGVTYYYRVRAYRASDTLLTGYSNVANATTTACGMVAPTNLTLTVWSSARIRLNWLETAPDATNYRIERSLDGLTNWTEVGSVLVDAGTFTDMGLACETPYYYRVRAYRSGDGGFSEYSTSASATTWPCALPTPTNLVVHNSWPDEIYFTWHDSPYDESEYRIERSLDGVTGWTEIGVHVVPPRPEPGWPPQLYLGPYYEDIGLGCSAHRYYRVRAYRTENPVFSDYSVVAEGSTMICAPSTLVATLLSPTQVQLTWADNASDETSYGVERSLTGTSGWTLLTSTIPANSTTYSDATATCGHTYYYRVFADRNSPASTSDNSNTVNVVIVCNPLVAPSGLSATSLSSTQIQLAWSDPNADETAIRIERSLDGVASWSQITSLSANTTTYTNTSLTCHTTYYYRVRAYRSSDVSYSPYTEVVSAATLNCPPATPVSLVATTQSVTQIQLTWNDAATDETEYRVERSPDGSTNWVEIASLPANTASYDDAGLTCSTSYYYRVRAYRGSDGVFSAYTTSATNRTLGCNLTAPSNLVATGQSATSMLLTWADNATDETGYRVERSANGTSGWTQFATLGANVVTYTNTTLTCQTTYYYRVRAYRSTDSSYSPYSAVATGTTTTCPPATPTSLAATTQSASQIQLTWVDNATNETDYRIERSANGTANWGEIATAPVNSTGYLDNGLGCGLYYYRVRAYRAGDAVFSAYSSSASALTVTCPFPAPSDLTVTGISATQTQLTWVDNATDETSYRVERSANGTTGWTQVASLAANTTSLINSSLTCETTYYYRVRAYRSSDATYTPYSAVTSGTTLYCALGIPTNLVATAQSANQILLTWTDNATSESSYRIERAPSGTTNWGEIGVVAANTSTYSDSSLACGTTYDYRVRAYRTLDSSFSTYSATASATTSACPLSAPSNLVAMAQSASQIQLTWVDNASNETSYRIERSNDGISGWSEVGNVNANVTSYTDASLVCETTRYYRVRAYRTSDTSYSAYSATANATTATCAPPAPSNLTTNAQSATQIQLTWVDNASNESSYRVERSNDGVSGWSEIGNVNANMTTYTDASLVCETTRYYRVRAYRSSDSSYSAYSNVIGGTTSLCLLLPPTNLSGVAVNRHQIRLSWIDAASGETAYRVERSPDGATWAEVADLAANTTTYLDNGLDCGRNYAYRVRAYRSTTSSFSAYSNTAYTGTAGCVGDSLVTFNASTNTANLALSLNSPLPSVENFTYATGFTHGTGGQYVVGDWDGDGGDTMGVYVGGAFWYTNDFGPTTNWTGIWFGLGGQAIAGRFNSAVGHDCIGVTDSGTWTTGDTFFALYFTCNLTSGPTPTLTYQWLSIVLPTSAGHSGTFQFSAGDFDGDGVDSIAIRRGNYIAWTNVPPTTLLSEFSLAQYFGAPGTGDEGKFVVGDWDLNNMDSFGLVYQNGRFYRRNDLQWNSNVYLLQQFTPLVGTPFGVTTWRP